MIRVDDNAIAEGGDFGKSENVWFQLQDCSSDSDCDDGEIKTTRCSKEATACLHKPRPCDEHGHMVSINTTTFNFPEAADWKIEDHDEDFQLEGGAF